MKEWQFRCLRCKTLFEFSETSGAICPYCGYLGAELAMGQEVKKEVKVVDEAIEKLRAILGKGLSSASVPKVRKVLEEMQDECS